MMRKVALFVMLVIAVLLIGCATEEIGVKSEEQYEQEVSSSEQRESASASGSSAQEEREYVVEDEDEVEERITVKDSGSGDDVTFKKIEDYRRDRDVTEKCDMEYPFECADSLAKDGIIYLTIKNIGYGSKVDEVTLMFDGDECDPVETFIEPGQVKEFECYSDRPAGDVVSGRLEVDYYVPTQKIHQSKGGELVILME